MEYENTLSKRQNEPHVTVGLCYQYSLLIEQNERSAEAAASDQTVWRRKQIGHAKPASPQQTNSLLMGFSGAEKVNLLWSLEESLGPHVKDSAKITGSSLERAFHTAVQQVTCPELQ